MITLSGRNAERVFNVKCTSSSYVRPDVGVRIRAAVRALPATLDSKIRIGGRDVRTRLAEATTDTFHVTQAESATIDGRPRGDPRMVVSGAVRVRVGGG